MSTVPRPQTRSRVPPLPARRHLRLVPGEAGSAATRRRPESGTARAGLPFVAIALFAVALFVFGLVILHILVAQGSFRLQDLQSKVREEEGRRRQMLYQVARAESPVAVADAAARLGLVVPDSQRYLLGPPDKVLPARGGGDSGSEEIKAILGAP